MERSFAHVCETGGARRTWLCGIEKVCKRYLIAAMAHNLGRLMRALFGMGTPRGLQSSAAALVRAPQLALLAARILRQPSWPPRIPFDAQTPHRLRYIPILAP